MIAPTGASTGFERTSYHRRAGRPAHVGLATYSHKKERGLDEVSRHQQHRDVHQHPDESDGKQAQVIEYVADVHLHANGGYEDVDENSPPLAGPDPLQPACPGEAEQEAEGGGKHDHPEEAAGEGVKP